MPTCARQVQILGGTVELYSRSGTIVYPAAGDDAAITIPVVSISRADGNELATAIKAGTPTVSLRGVRCPSEDAMVFIFAPSVLRAHA